MPGIGSDDNLMVRLVAGALASATTEFCTLPIDTVKVRLQCQALGVAAGQEKPYRGMTHAFLKIPQEEGVKGLWKGLGPALARQVFYSTLCVVMYGPIRNSFVREDGSISFGGKLAAGGIAGGLSLMFAHPVEVVKIRMQADATGTQYRGMVHAFKKIYKAEGHHALARGLIPNIQRGIIVNAVELGVYDEAKFGIMRTGLLNDGFGLHFAASTVAGVASAVASTPVDVVKTRLMNQGKNAEVHYSGMMDCLVKTTKQEGPLALYKGFVPIVTRKIPFCVLFFVSFEQFSKAVSFLN